MIGKTKKDNGMENLEQQTHDFDDIVEAMQDERESQLPKYPDFISSVFGEQKRICEQSMKKGGDNE